MTPLLSLEKLFATVEGHQVLNGVSLIIQPGEMHVLMGPNGSGKSSLALTILGHPDYKATSGGMTFNGASLLQLTTDARARLGMFLSFQNPVAIPGVSVAQLTRVAAKHIATDRPIDVKSFRTSLKETLVTLHLPETFLDRSVNEGFSGGEKKLSEILQMAAVAPKFIILDEPDSGLDLDAIKRVASVITSLRTKERGMLIITHNPRILETLKPDFVHLFQDGKIVRTGGLELSAELERTGYAESKSSHE